MHSNSRQFVLSLLVLLLSTSIIAAFASQPHVLYHAEADSYIDIWITPAVIFSGDTAYELQWTSQRITGVFLNEQGKIGAFQETISNTCEVNEFLVNFENGEQVSLTAQPFSLLHPHIIALFIVSLISISIILTPLKIPIFKSIGHYFAPLYDWGAEKFWHRWIGLILFNTCLFTGFLYLTDTCHSQAVHSVGSHFLLSHIVLVSTSLITFFVLVLGISRSSVLLRIKQLIKSIPYPLVIVGIFAYWGVCFYLLLIFNLSITEGIIIPLALFIFIIGATIIHIRLQPNKILSTDHSLRQPVNPAFMIVTSVLWILAYQIEWVALIQNDVLQAFVGIILYMLPGVLFALILKPTITHWSSLLTTGFILSFVLAVILWLIVLILGSSATVLQWLYTLVGLIFLVRLSYQQFPSQLFHLELEWKISHTLLLSLGILSILVVLSQLAEPGFGNLGGDYRAYNPLVSLYAQAETFTLLDPYLGSDITMQYRMWLAVWTVPQALIINFSQLHILTSFHLLSFYLAIFVFITSFDVVRRFDIPQSFCFIAFPILAFLIITHLHPDQFGLRFLRTISQDKLMVSFVLAPLAVVTTLEYLKQPSRINLFLVILSILAVMLGHPTKFFNTSLIIGAMTCLYVIIRSHHWRHIIIIAVICGTWMTIPFGIRIVSEAEGVELWTGDVEYMLELRSAHVPSNESETGEYLGIDPDLINDEVYVMLGLAVILSLFYIRQNNAFLFIVPFVLLLLVALQPFTSIILGRIISHSQLWRIPWMLSYGVIGAMTLWMCYLSIRRLSPMLSSLFHWSMIILASVLFIVSFSIALSPPYGEWDIRAARLQDRLMRTQTQPATQLSQIYRDAAEIGDYIRLSADHKVYILADQRGNIHHLIPSMGAGLHGITWYSPLFPRISYDEFNIRNRKYNALFSDSLTVEAFIETIETYDISYIILGREYERLERIMERSGLVDTDFKQFRILRLWKVDHSGN